MTLLFPFIQSTSSFGHLLWLLQRNKENHHNPCVLENCIPVTETDSKLLNKIIDCHRFLEDKMTEWKEREAKDQGPSQSPPRTCIVLGWRHVGKEGVRYATVRGRSFQKGVMSGTPFLTEGTTGIPPGWGGVGIMKASTWKPVPMVYWIRMHEE
jgi:hypothetical protein